MFASNIRFLTEACSLTLQNNFSFYLLPRKATLEKRQVKPVRRHTNVSKKPLLMTLTVSGNRDRSPTTSPLLRPFDKQHSRKERRHSFSGNSVDIVQLREKSTDIEIQALTPSLSTPLNDPKTKANSKSPGGTDSSTTSVSQTSEIGTYHVINNNSYLEKIPYPAKIMKMFLLILKEAKLALDERMLTSETSGQPQTGNGASQQDLEVLYNVARKAVQSALIFFMHKSLELANKNWHLERLMPLIIEFQQVEYYNITRGKRTKEEGRQGYIYTLLYTSLALFFTDASEPDFFFLGLMHVLIKLLPDVARFGGDTTNSSQTNERLAQHCLNVWDCVLMYQSHFLIRYLKQEQELNEKLRLIVTKRTLFLQWLRKDGLARAQTTLSNIFGKPWSDRHVIERNQLRERFEKDKFCSKMQHEKLLVYERKLKSIPMNVLYNNTTIKDLQSVEQARQLSRQHQFYYRDLFCRNKWFELIVLKLQVQSALWIQVASLPWDEAWNINFVEGPHRMRKILKRHAEFIRTYKANRRQFMELLSKMEPMQKFMRECSPHSHTTKRIDAKHNDTLTNGQLQKVTDEDEDERQRRQLQDEEEEENEFSMVHRISRTNASMRPRLPTLRSQRPRQETLALLSEQMANFLIDAAFGDRNEAPSELKKEDESVEATNKKWSSYSPKQMIESGGASEAKQPPSTFAHERRRISTIGKALKHDDPANNKKENNKDDKLPKRNKQIHNDDYPLTAQGILPFEQSDGILEMDGDTLGIVDRISRVLSPGDVFDPTRTYNCSTISGLNEDRGIVLLCRYSIYFFYHIQVILKTG
ncbi:hypothetical protein RFI_14947 [Reticulomyxa filosa]|uniref:Uncharacterized protein n=1 Tax=Reticulomyxa filosa TaxID=46433 RepID=X6NAB3_RETFI|nr:hypothetical protein RFI_14947 [Reticulomyxa filosa]|eukprot:ETO22252.1 hypothetical protein RFI_14947 [Reticulomyxa filosa]